MTGDMVEVMFCVSPKMVALFYRLLAVKDDADFWTELADACVAHSAHLNQQAQFSQDREAAIHIASQMRDMSEITLSVASQDTKREKVGADNKPVEMRICTPLPLGALVCQLLRLQQATAFWKGFGDLCQALVRDLEGERPYGCHEGGELHGQYAVLAHEVSVLAQYARELEAMNDKSMEGMSL